MLREEEVLRTKALDRGVQGVVIEKNGSENAAFSFYVVRKRTFDADFGGGHLPWVPASLYFRPGLPWAQELYLAGKSALQQQSEIVLRILDLPQCIVGK
jgi:hypothetical protein